VADAGGAVVRRADGPARAGLNHVVIPLGGGRGTFGGRGGAAAPPPLAVGSYHVTVEVAGRTLTKTALVRARID
jgi:hypothetical protein